MAMDNYPAPVSDPEAEGLPATADDDSTAYDDVATGRAADGPDPAALPGDVPLAVDRYGVTPEEAAQGESLDYKLAREEVEGRADDVTGERWTPPDRTDLDPSDGVDMASDELDRPGPNAGLDDEAAPDPGSTTVSMYDVPDDGGPVGRLVEPDEGAHEDREADAVATDAGAAGGGMSAEELAMHEISEF
jgi:hypothetical protein